MRKWKNVLWLVFASLAFGGASLIFFRRTDPRHMKVAEVNGQEISFGEYQRTLAEVKASIDMYKSYARAYGLPIDLFLNMTGLDNPEEAAFDKCVKNKLVDQIKDSLRMEFDKQIFNDELAKSIPPYLVDSSGKLDMNAYRNYLNRIGTTVPEYEESKEDEFVRDLVGKFVGNSFYRTASDLKEKLVEDKVKKRFKFLHFPLNKFLDEVKKQEVTDEELKKYFQKHKEIYRIGEKAKIKYWMLTPKEYENKIVIDAETVENFYERNKSSLFRIPPKVKVRHIFLQLPEMVSPDQAELISKQASDILVKAKANPNSFAELAKQHSQDPKTASKGGLVDFFEKGSYAPEFEKAAFRLKQPGDISDVIKTKDGLEIIKLEERIASSSKPLSTVSDEITKTLTAKKALAKLKGDIESLLYQARSDKEAFLKFVQTNKMKEEQTPWLTRNDVDGEKVENLLAQKFFSPQKTKKDYGYFVTEGLHIIYMLSERQNSYLPDFEKIKDKVLKDFRIFKAKENLKVAVKKAKKSLLFEKTTMEKVAENSSLTVKKTEMIKKEEKVKGFSSESVFSKVAFSLTDPYQVLKFKDASDYYLAQLVEEEKLKEEEAKKDTLEEREEGILTFDAFIASLFRNATIVKTEKVLNINPIPESEI